MTTQCQSLGLSEPVRFLNSTVLSFNASLGLGTQESTLSVDLVDDCDPDSQAIAGNFLPLNDPNVMVGAPVYFPDNTGVMPFSFGGVLTNWTIQQSSNGRTYNVKVADPRQLLENTVVILDSYVGAPIKGVNYFNVYAYFEKDILDVDCSKFGTSGSNDRGMPYTKIIKALTNIDPTICSPTGYRYKVDFASFPGVSTGRAVPDWYRVPGPSVTLLQLLQDMCDTLAYEFYVELIGFGGQNIITVRLIDLSLPPSSFKAVVGSYEGLATDLSYGQELRNEKTKMVLFGEKVHYLSYVNNFEYFFGEDFNPQTNTLEPVVPYAVDDCGFWISKRVESLNLSLNTPLPSNGPYQISEMDIRCAMGSHEMWKNRAFDENSRGTFNEAIRNNWPDLVSNRQNMFDNLINMGGAQAAARGASDIAVSNQLNQAELTSNDNKIVEDLEKVRGFLSNLGSTYYGKQFLAKLNQRICWYRDGDEEDLEIFYSDIPTGDGGWVDAGPVIGLDDPDLGFFRQDDNRVGCFARFTVSGSGTEPEDDKTSTNPDFPSDDEDPPSQS